MPHVAVPGRLQTLTGNADEQHDLACRASAAWAGTGKLPRGPAINWPSFSARLETSSFVGELRIRGWVAVTRGSRAPPRCRRLSRPRTHRRQRPRRQASRFALAAGVRVGPVQSQGSRSSPGSAQQASSLRPRRPRLAALQPGRAYARGHGLHEACLRGAQPSRRCSAAGTQCRVGSADRWQPCRTTWLAATGAKGSCRQPAVSQQARAPGTSAWTCHRSALAVPLCSTPARGAALTVSCAAEPRVDSAAGCNRAAGDLCAPAATCTMPAGYPLLPAA